MKVAVSILVVVLLGGLAWWLMRPRRQEPPAHVQRLPGGRVPDPDRVAGPDTSNARPDEAPAAAASTEPGATAEPGDGDHDGDGDGEAEADTAGTTEPTTGTEEGPYGPGSAAAAEDGSGPEGWTVKGNEDSRLYHTPESHSWEQTRAEVWFASEEAAEAAGFSRWDRNE